MLIFVNESPIDGFIPYTDPGFTTDFWVMSPLPDYNLTKPDEPDEPQWNKAEFDNSPKAAPGGEKISDSAL